MLTVSNTVLNRIWQPDTYFENSKRSTFHDVTVANKMLRIHQNGKVEYNARLVSSLVLTKSNLVLQSLLQAMITAAFSFDTSITLYCDLHGNNNRVRYYTLCTCYNRLQDISKSILSHGPANVSYGQTAMCFEH